jgi:hypothetical protein
MDQLTARQSAQCRLTLSLLGSFGVLGVAIAEVGIFGLMAEVVAQRTREIGVRMALLFDELITCALTRFSVGRCRSRTSTFYHPRPE